MHSCVVKWLSEFLKCSTFVDAVKATSTKGRPLKTPCMQCQQLLRQRRRVHAWHHEKFILLFKLKVFATSPRLTLWKPHPLPTFSIRLR